MSYGYHALAQIRYFKYKNLSFLGEEHSPSIYDMGSIYIQKYKHVAQTELLMIIDRRRKKSDITILCKYILIKKFWRKYSKSTIHHRGGKAREHISHWFLAANHKQ